MSRKPLPRMMRMKPMITINAKHHKPPHHINLRRRARVILHDAVRYDRRLGHRVRRAQPKSAHAAPGHVAAAAGADHA